MRSVILAFLLAGSIVASAQSENVDELRSKPEWSYLQRLEFQYRADQVAGLIVEKNKDYCAVGIPALNKNSRVWMLLNAKYRPLVKKLPDIEYRLAGDNLADILKSCAVSDTVRGELERHMEAR